MLESPRKRRLGQLSEAGWGLCWAGSSAAGGGEGGGEAGDECVEGVAPEVLGVREQSVAAELGPGDAFAEGVELERRLGDAAAAK